MSETNGKLTDREAFLQATTRRYKVVDLQDGSRIRIQSMNELERGRFEAGMLDLDTGKPNPVALAESHVRLIIICAVDGDGRRLFTDKDIPSLQQKDGVVTEELASAINQHCGLGKSKPEDLAKNSNETLAERSLVV